MSKSREEVNKILGKVIDELIEVELEEATKSLSSKNECGKTRKVENPYEIYRSYLLPEWEWRVLKKYQSPKSEAKNPYARWFCAVKSPMTYDEWEYGDTYIKDILVTAQAYRVEE